MYKKLDHVGIMVRDFDEAIERFGGIFHISRSDMRIQTIIDPESGNPTKVAFLFIGNNFIELINPNPTDSKSRFGKFLQEKGEGLFHLSVFTEEFDKEVDEWKQKGFILPEIEINSGSRYTTRVTWLPLEATGGIQVEVVDETSLPPALPSK